MVCIGIDNGLNQHHDMFSDTNFELLRLVYSPMYCFVNDWLQFSCYVISCTVALSVASCIVVLRCHLWAIISAEKVGC